MKLCGLWGRLPLVTLVLLLTFCSMITEPAWSQSSTADTAQGTTSGAGMQVAALGATLVYAPFKIVLAIGGGIIGGLAYAFSGGSEQTAKGIWIPSMYGTYLITPEHLNGDRPVRFFGIAAESDAVQHEAAPMSSPEPVPAPVPVQ